MVRDVFPANLIYINYLTLDGVPNSGNILSGFNIGSIGVNQTRTITYRAQVAPAQNFNFGQTATLVNLVNVTGDNNTQGSASASVNVTRSGVLGATAVSTGLTNNPWVDSFFLPLLIALVGVWFFRSRIIGMPAWVNLRMANNKEFSAQRKLDAAIEQIKREEEAR